MKESFKSRIERCSIECKIYVDLGYPVDKVVAFFEIKYPDLMIESKRKKDGRYEIAVC